jgi:FkbM family methyltransferase
MLLRELLPLAKDVARVVDVSPATVNLRRPLAVPYGMPHVKADPADLAGTELTGDTLLVFFDGPQEGTDALRPALRALPGGAKVLVLVGWTPEEYPYRLAPGLLADGGCRLIDAVPVEQSGLYGVHLALIAERVDSAGEAPEAPATTADEHLLGELVAQLMRRRVRELDDRVAELQKESAATRDSVKALRAELADRNKALANARRRAKTLESSASYRVGRTLVDGAKHPGKAVVSVPMNLTKIWRSRRARAATPPVVRPPADTHRTVLIPVPGSPERTLTVTAPIRMLVPRQIAKTGLGSYEASSIPCFLAALDAAGPGAVLDVGANIGLYAALAAAVSDREVVAFEPLPALAETAERVSADNDLGYRVESIALGRENGSATLYVSDSSDASNSLAAGFRKSTEQIEVPVETLDGYVQRTGLVPAVIKVDTESTEPDVLFGATETLREHRPWVLCEVLFGRVEERLTEVLAPYGYHWYHITDEVPYRLTTVIEGDRSYDHLMWLFAPEPPDDAFWAAVTTRRKQIAETEPAPAD